MDMIVARIEIDLERRAEIGMERRSRTRAAIIGAAFELFGSEEGLYSRIDDIASRAGVTRTTFYNHFSGMSELRDAVTRELTHDFLLAVTETVRSMDDARLRASVALRYYLHRARSDARWAWSMINVSANGIIFGEETYRQAEITVQEGIESGVFQLTSSKIGRDMILGTCLAAIAAMVREDVPENYPEIVSGHILVGLRVPFEDARRCANFPLPPLRGSV